MQYVLAGSKFNTLVFCVDIPKMKSLVHMGEVMNGQSCRFWPFGAVENKCILVAHSLSGRLGGIGALPRAL